MNWCGFLLTTAVVGTLLSCGPQAQDQVAVSDGSEGFAGPTLTGDYSGKTPMNSMVLISRKGARGYGFCGGLLIGKNKVLTAGHCVNASGSAEGLNVIFPNKDKKASTSTGTFSFQKYKKVLKVHLPKATHILPGTNVHDERDWNSGVALFDLAVLDLEGTAPDYVVVFNPANLATNEDLRTGKLSAFGWNSDEFDTNGADYMDLVRKENRAIQTAKSDLLERFFHQERPMKEYCKTDGSRSGDCEDSQSIMRSLYGIQIDSFKFLTTSSNPVCKGDSGSPLFVITKDGQYKLLGVASSALAIDGREVDRVLTGIAECSAHTFYQGVPAMKKWFQAVTK